MSVKLDVRIIGFYDKIKGDKRSPESFSLPACATSLMEYIGEDVKWISIGEWKKRTLNDAILAATGMAFGLLWHRDVCPSCFDLTQVNDHNATIKHAFDYVGYDCEIIEKTGSNIADMKRMITESIDSGRPVLAFGIVGPPECSIVCGYDSGGDTLFGWSHFQSSNPADCENNGMFRISDWYDGIWKIVLCGDKREPENDLKDILRRGVAIATANELNGYLSGAAAYDAWVKYVTDPAYERMEDKALRKKYWLHSSLVGNHAEARCYLAGFLHESAGGDAELRKVEDFYQEIHNTCWRLWDATGGMGNPEAYKAFRDKAKRDKAAEIIRKIEELDFTAVEGLRAWLEK